MTPCPPPPGSYGFVSGPDVGLDIHYRHFNDIAYANLEDHPGALIYIFENSCVLNFTHELSTQAQQLLFN